MSFEDIEKFIKKYPLYQYAFIKPGDIEYSKKIRQLCKRDCPNYGLSWSCPPAIGKIEKCREICLRYTDLLVFSTLTELDRIDIDEMASAQKEHERLTDIVKNGLLRLGYISYIITSSWCKKCPKCTFPRDFCRHGGEIYPCIESHGIAISDLTQKCKMDYYLGSRLYLLFSLIFFEDVEVRQ